MLVDDEAGRMKYEAPENPQKWDAGTKIKHWISQIRSNNVNHSRAMVWTCGCARASEIDKKTKESGVDT
jgi:hypothetical protein